MNNIDRYTKIVEEEESILKEIRESLLTNSNLVQNNFEEIQIAFMEMENSKKQLEKIKKIEKCVSELLTRIANTSNVEELINLRKCLNNEIRKVRNVLSSTEGFNSSKNEELIIATRTNISKLFRNIKRKTNLEEIDMLLHKDTLPDEEKQALTKKLRNEKNYIKRTKTPKTVDDAKNAIEAEKNRVLKTKREIAKLIQPYTQSASMSVTGMVSSVSVSFDSLGTSNADTEEFAYYNPVDLSSSSHDTKEMVITPVRVKTETAETYTFSEVPLFGAEDDESLDENSEYQSSQAAYDLWTTILGDDEDEEAEIYFEEHSDTKHLYDLKRLLKANVERYAVREPIEYKENNFFGNIAIFFQNLAIRNHNKKALSIVSYDYYTYSRQRPLKMVRDYLIYVTSNTSSTHLFNDEQMEKAKVRYSERFAKNVLKVRDILTEQKTLVKTTI